METPNTKDKLQAEATFPATAARRLAELVGSSEPEVARVATSRLMRAHIEQGLAELAQGSTPGAVALTLMAAAVKLLPADSERVAVRG